MTEKYLLFNLDDEKAKSLGEVIASSTSRKIVNLLAETELSESEIAGKLKLPLNTAEYNLKKLLEAGIIEKSRHLWSEKGRKIELYKVANKLIVISTKKSNVYNKLRGIMPVVLVSAVFSGFIWLYEKTGLFVEKAENLMSAPQIEIVSKGAEYGGSFLRNLNSVDWFLIGVWVLIIIYAALSLRKN